MASLTGQTIASTYDALLKITDNGAITSSLKQITDGLGNNTPLFLSATTLYVNGNLRAGGALYDGNNEPGTNGQFLVSTGTGVDWQNIAESGLITGSGTNGFISKFTASGVIANSVIQENSSNIGIGISPTQKLHVSGNGLFTGTLTASNVSGSTSGTNTGDENTASIKSKLGLVSAIQDGYLSSVDYESFTNKVPSTRTISINGETFDLSANRTYSVNVGVTSFNTRTGAVVLGSGDITTALGYIPALNSRIMTINGVGYNLSADRTWSVGTVTSVGTSAPLTGGTITSTGTIGITQSGASADGYLSSTDWNTFNNKQAALGFTPENSANKGANNGYASLDGAGKVPSGQLPSYVDDVVEVANYAALPATGETGKIYITLDTNFVYRWSGTVYVKISEPNAVWGSITGTLSNQTDLQSALNAKVDNTRTITINGTASDLSANRTFNVGTVTSVSGTGSVSGLSLSGSVTSSGSLTLGGTLALTSGDVTTGLGYTPVTNARTLSINGTVLDLTANRSWSVGTVTSVGLDLGTAGTDLSVANSPVTSSGNITLNIPTASATNRGALSSTDWSTFNNKQNTLTLTTTGSSGASTLVGATLNIPTYTLSGLGGQPLLTNPVTGTGTSGYLTRFTGSTTVGNSIIFDNGTQVGIGTASPSYLLHVKGSSLYNGAIFADNSSTTGAGSFQVGQNGTSKGSLSLSGTFNGDTSSDISLFADTGFGARFYTNGVNERMRITSAGNVGIGTSSPALRFDVISTSQYDGIRTYNTSSTQGADIRVGNDANNNLGFLRVGGSDLGNANANTLMVGTGGGYDIHIAPNGNPAITAKNGGNVGIGTTSPAVPLDVVSNSTANGINLRTRVNDDYGFLNFKSYNASEILSEIYVHRTAANVASLIFTTNNGTSSAERMRINSSGNVGIGTSSPAYKLDVNGSSIFRTWSSMAAGIPFAWNSVSGLYVATGYSAAINTEIADGAMTFFTAPSGTAGASATFSERMRITSAGIVCIANTAGLGGTLSVANTSGNSGIAVKDAQGNGSLMKFINSSGSEIGSITTNGFTTAYNVSSDYRLKQDLKDYSGLDLINEIKTYDYEWKANNSRMYGVLAHELQEVIPYAVAGEKDGENMQGVDYSKIVPILVKAIQELKAELDELKNNK